ncbi:MAG TPA: LLM class flavin-dependent oxidoreductase, partial [Thermomicrobiales bacterium]|nr:LLM class flavin-dependent oxidoreductase [Thermomicrobiales bacterium]
MKFSLFYNFDILPETDERDLLGYVEAQAVAADALGYDGIWLAEHHFQEYGRMPSPLTFLARLSGLTTGLRLGTAVVEAPYYHPLRLAEDAALLDVLSGGRVQLGLGSGAGNKELEFERFSIPKEEKSARLMEIVEILRQALAEEIVDFAGEFYTHRDLTISPRPRQGVQSLLWLAASPTTIPYAARHALPILLPRPVPEQRVRDLIAGYRDTLAPGIPGHVAALRFTFVAETREEAFARTHATFMRYAKYDGGVDWDGRTDTAEYRDLCAKLKFVAGTPDDVAAQLEEWIGDLQPDEILCQMF